MIECLVTAPSQPDIHEWKQLIPHSVLYPTVYYKIDFVLDDFALLQATSSVMSMFKVG